MLPDSSVWIEILAPHRMFPSSFFAFSVATKQTKPTKIYVKRFAALIADIFPSSVAAFSCVWPCSSKHSLNPPTVWGLRCCKFATTKITKGGQVKNRDKHETRVQSWWNSNRTWPLKHICHGRRQMVSQTDEVRDRKWDTHDGRHTHTHACTDTEANGRKKTGHTY